MTIVPMGAPQEIFQVHSADEIEKVVAQSQDQEKFHFEIKFSRSIGKNLVRTTQVLKDVRGYISIGMSRVNLGDDECQHLAALFQMKNLHIYALDLSFNRITDNGMSLLVPTSSFMRLLYLNVSFTDLTSMFIRTFGQAVQSSGAQLQLIELELTGTKITDDCRQFISIICQAAKQLERVAVAATNIKIRTALDIATQLSKTRSLHTVNFNCLNLVDTQIAFSDYLSYLNRFITTLFQISTLQKIDVSGIAIQDTGMKLVVQALSLTDFYEKMCHFQLQQLNLNSCQLSDSAIADIISILRAKTRISCIQLQGNQLTDAGLLQLLQFVSTSNCKIQLDLRYNLISDSYAHEVSKQVTNLILFPNSARQQSVKEIQYRGKFLTNTTDLKSIQMNEIVSRSFKLESFGDTMHQDMGDFEPLLVCAKEVDINTIDSAPIKRNLIVKTQQILKRGSERKAEHDIISSAVRSPLNPTETLGHKNKIKGLLETTEYFYDTYRGVQQSQMQQQRQDRDRTPTELSAGDENDGRESIENVQHLQKQDNRSYSKDQKSTDKKPSSDNQKTSIFVQSGLDKSPSQPKFASIQVQPTQMQTSMQQSPDPHLVYSTSTLQLTEPVQIAPHPTSTTYKQFPTSETIRKPSEHKPSEHPPTDNRASGDFGQIDEAYLNRKSTASQRPTSRKPSQPAPEPVKIAEPVVPPKPTVHELIQKQSLMWQLASQVPADKKANFMKKYNCQQVRVPKLPRGQFFRPLSQVEQQFREDVERSIEATSRFQLDKAHDDRAKYEELGLRFPASTPKNEERDILIQKDCVVVVGLKKKDVPIIYSQNVQMEMAGQVAGKGTEIVFKEKGLEQHMIIQPADLDDLVDIMTVWGSQRKKVTKWKQNPLMRVVDK